MIYLHTYIIPKSRMLGTLHLSPIWRHNLVLRQWLSLLFLIRKILSRTVARDIGLLINAFRGISLSLQANTRIMSSNTTG